MQATLSDDQTPIGLREQIAIEVAATGTTPNPTIAAQLVGVAPTTVLHCVKGRKNKPEEAHQRQKWAPEEERAVIEYCY